MIALARGDSGNTCDERLFARIAHDIETLGYSIRPGALPEPLASGLLQHRRQIDHDLYVDAGIGRGGDYAKTRFVRTDEICWITGASEVGGQWLDWAGRLQVFLNRQLFLGLFSFESHFAHYAPGAYYRRHYDAFRGETNRVLSIVAYLNPGWSRADGGHLVLYGGDEDITGIRVVPLHGTVVVFLSEEFPHEVLPSNRDRYSIAGWFRVNASIRNAVDPPR